MLREIGSEFWDVPETDRYNCLFPAMTQWYISGRSALKSIILDLQNCHTVAMPSWCCDSMIKPFVDAGFDVHFYPVFWHDGLVREISIKCDVLFIMDYFGYTFECPNLENYRGIIIRDVTHSIFSSSYSDADYYFGSIRKWCGVCNGGYAWSRDGHRLTSGARDDYGYNVLRKEAMKQKAEYIRGERFDKNYLKIYKEAEAILENIEIVSSPRRDIKLAENMDVELIRYRHKMNAEVLQDAFANWLIFPHNKDKDCPMFVPVFVPNGRRDELRNYLIKHEIYCPIHWPVSEYHRLDERTKGLYENELSLVCDHRYTRMDMHRMVTVINEFMEI